jgi:hypothetical protein
MLIVIYKKVDNKEDGQKELPKAEPGEPGKSFNYLKI